MLCYVHTEYIGLHVLSVKLFTAKHEHVNKLCIFSINFVADEVIIDVN